MAVKSMVSFAQTPHYGITHAARSSADVISNRTSAPFGAYLCKGTGTCRCSPDRTSQTGADWFWQNVRHLQVPTMSLCIRYQDTDGCQVTDVWTTPDRYMIDTHSR